MNARQANRFFLLFTDHEQQFEQQTNKARWGNETAGLCEEGVCGLLYIQFGVFVWGVEFFWLLCVGALVNM